MEKEKKSISTTFLVSFLIIIFLSLTIQVVLLVNNVSSIRSVLKEQSEALYLESHKKIIKHEVDQVVNSIDSIRKDTEQRLRQELAGRVNAAHGVASNIYTKNIQQADRQELHRLVIDALVPLLSAEKYEFFILATDSGELLYCRNHPYGDKLIAAECPALGQIKTDIAPAGEGFTLWVDPKSGARNVIFAKRFSPMGLTIGAGFHVADMDAAAKEAVLKEIGRSRYGGGGSGYLFAFQYDGLYLSHVVPSYVGQNLLEITDPNGVQINREIVKTCKNGGGYVSYLWDRYKKGGEVDKISYVKGYGDWQWVVGTGFYLDDMAQVVAEQEESLQEQLEKFFIRIWIFSILIFLLSAVIVKLIVGRMNRELSLFRNFFKNAALHSHKINLDEVKYLEFHRLAENANTMLAERKAAEMALVQSEERFRHLVADLPKIAVQGYDSNRKIIYWNRACETLYGYTKEEAIGKKLEELIIPESMAEQVIKDIRNWYENGVTIPSSELLLKNKSGAPVPVYASHVMLVSNRGEKTMYCVDMDLAELKHAQEKELKNESFYRGLFEHSTSGVAVYEAVDDGKDFIFREFNSAGEKMDGVSREDLLGRRVSEVFLAAKELGIPKVLRQVWQTGQPASHSASFYDDGKRQFWRENRIYKLPTGEVVAVFDDVTKEKELETEKKSVELRLYRAQKMEAIGLMAGGVAHDLNNILTGLTGYPDILLHQLPKESELRQPIEAIKESGQRAAAVVADLLTVARGVASIKSSADINALLEEYLRSPEWYQLHSLHRDVRCELLLDKELPSVLCSAVHVKKCIMNLVGNAMEAMDLGGTVTLGTRLVAPELVWGREHGLTAGEYAVLSVADTGTGVSRKDRDHIFEPFYTKKVMGRSGTGLGLAVVWNTMEDHLGKVLLKDCEQGSCFELYFPLGGEGTYPEAPTSKVTEGRHVGRGHILVVDDEALLRDVAAQMLLANGYQVDQVASGEEAIAFLKKQSVDLVLLDMLMGTGMNGYETYQKILAMLPGQKALIASGFSENDDIEAALELGAGGFIKKPYSMDQLVSGVRKVL